MIQTFFELSKEEQAAALDYYDLKLRRYMFHHVIVFEDNRFNVLDTIEQGITLYGKEFYTTFRNMVQKNAETSLYSIGERIVDLDFQPRPKFIGEKI